MSHDISFPLVAVDIGNSRIKLGLFDSPGPTDALHRPSRTLLLSTGEWDPVEIALWLAPQKPAAVRWVLASVHSGEVVSMRKWLSAETRADDLVELQNSDLPVEIGVPQPAAVGIDRLLGAVAANRLRPSGRPAIVIDLGTAMTVDVVSSRGKFCGGSILPGIEMSARALHKYTDMLPELRMSTLDEPPPALGTSTDQAIVSGLFWGAVGAMRVLIEQLHQDMQEEPFVILTGGAARRVTELLEVPVCYEPHLVLAGMVLSAGA
jgi:type III pantothenate kinase